MIRSDIKTLLIIYRKDFLIHLDARIQNTKLPSVRLCGLKGYQYSGSVIHSDIKTLLIIYRKDFLIHLDARIQNTKLPSVRLCGLKGYQYSGSVIHSDIKTLLIIYRKNFLIHLDARIQNTKLPSVRLCGLKGYQYSGSVIHLQFGAYGSWDSLFPYQWVPTANFWVQNTIFNDRSAILFHPGTHLNKKQQLCIPR